MMREVRGDDVYYHAVVRIHSSSVWIQDIMTC